MLFSIHTVPTKFFSFRMNSEAVMGQHEEMPIYSPGKSRYDTTTYWGRLKHFTSMIDPRLLFVRSDELAGARTLIAEFARSPIKRLSRIENQELWNAQRIIDSGVNPATGEVIHPIARMCAFIPASLPITLGMLTMTSTASVLALQWINQSYNAVFNYSHRSNASSEKSQVLKAYALATGTSCGIALGLSKFAGRIKPPWIISTLAVMAAGSANVAFTRSSELRDGVDVYNTKGDSLGKSQIAGRYAVGYTILSRSILLPIPIMVLPGIMSSLAIRTWFRSGVGNRTKLLVDISCIILAQAFALPVCIAAFPQTLAMERKELEPSFNSDDPADQIVYVRKGV